MFSFLDFFIPIFLLLMGTVSYVYASVKSDQRIMAMEKNIDGLLERERKRRAQVRKQRKKDVA